MPRPESAAEAEAVVLRRDGTVWSWSPRAPLPAPQQAAGLADITDLACSCRLCAVLRSDGAVLGWGTTHFTLGGTAPPFARNRSQARPIVGMRVD